MKELTKEELMNIKGGGFSIGLGVVITAAVAFVIGIVDGIVRPLKCN